MDLRNRGVTGRELGSYIARSLPSVVLDEVPSVGLRAFGTQASVGHRDARPGQGRWATLKLLCWVLFAVQSLPPCPSGLDGVCPGDAVLPFRAVGNGGNVKKYDRLVSSRSWIRSALRTLSCVRLALSYCWHACPRLELQVDGGSSSCLLCGDASVSFPCFACLVARHAFFHRRAVSGIIILHI